MSLRPSARRRVVVEGPLEGLRLVEAPRVTAVSSTLPVGPCLRACADAVNALDEVAEARAWARGDLDREARVRAAVSALNSATYAAALVALDAPPF